MGHGLLHPSHPHLKLGFLVVANTPRMMARGAAYNLSPDRLPLAAGGPAQGKLLIDRPSGNIVFNTHLYLNTLPKRKYHNESCRACFRGEIF